MSVECYKAERKNLKKKIKLLQEQVEKIDRLIEKENLDKNQLSMFN